MHLNQKLYTIMAARAERTTITEICMGLGYTAVTTSDGGLGLAYTYFENKTGCTPAGAYVDHEGRPAVELLAMIRSDSPLERSKALALINALNFDQLQGLPNDRRNDTLFDLLGIESGSRVAMVGYFKPLMRLIESRGAKATVIDAFQGIGEPKAFFHKLSQWADSALITSTAILNNTMESILDRLPADARAAVLGPSTPLIPDLFADWPAVKALAGTVPVNIAAVLKAVRHGLGTPYLHRHSRKATITTQVTA
jgi:uncharacterized protein (DUF4213/DUF364 family)